MGARHLTMRKNGLRAALRTARPPLRRQATARLEALEARMMLAADLRSFTGLGNNPWHSTWGAAGVQLLRTASAEYDNGTSSPAGADRAGARAISEALVAQTDDGINSRELSAFVYAWGQFVDHDLDLTPAGTTESFPVPVPLGDPYFDPNSTGTQTIGLSRSIYDPATGTTNPRQQLNVITAYLDGSQIYGSDADRAAALRTLAGGKLKTSDGGLLPYNTLGLANDNPLRADPTTLFVAGDVRANENIELTAIHTLFVREHNRLADRIAARNPTLTDEQIYQQARRLVIGELQAITYNEFLPALLGPFALRSYRGYNPQVNPGIATEFSTAAFRLGHSMLGDDVEFLDNDGAAIRDEVELRNAFFNPSLLAETGIDSIFKYLASDRAQEIDNQVVDDVRNFLFGQPGQGGFDLTSLNIQRGRDHGLADYNSVRAAYGLRPVTSFAEITKNVETQQALEEVYGNVNNIDLWVGGLAEDHVPGGGLGPLFTRIVADQFQRLRDGDRFWYERDLNFAELQQVRGTSLADVVARNTTTNNLQQNVFFFHAKISGQVSLDLNRLSGFNFWQKTGVPGITVQLQDADGNILATTVTGRDGRYSFDGLDLSTYRVRIVLPEILRQITQDPTDITITRGSSIDRVNFGLVVKWPSRLTSSQVDSIFGQFGSA